MALTDTRLRTLKPKGKAELLEAGGNGLYIRVRVGQGGVSRTWQFRRKESGRLTIKTLGTYPDLSIKEALGTRRVRDIEPADIAGVIRTYRDRVGGCGAATGRLIAGPDRRRDALCADDDKQAGTGPALPAGDGLAAGRGLQRGTVRASIG
jgi:hypothetical protein